MTQNHLTTEFHHNNWTELELEQRLQDAYDGPRVPRRLRRRLIARFGKESKWKTSCALWQRMLKALKRTMMSTVNIFMWGTALVVIACSSGLLAQEVHKTHATHHSQDGHVEPPAVRLAGFWSIKSITRDAGKRYLSERYMMLAPSISG
jgi:hypothetical protein